MEEGEKKVLIVSEGNLERLATELEAAGYTVERAKESGRGPLGLKFMMPIVRRCALGVRELGPHCAGCSGLLEE